MSLAPLTAPSPIDTRTLPNGWPSTSSGSSPAQWLIELVILLALLNIVALATVGPLKLGAFSPNPYWIPVVLMSCQHGTLAGVTAAMTAVSIHWLSGAPSVVGNEDLYDYLHRVWREPMLWLVAAVVIGGLRRQQAQKLEELRRRLLVSNERLEVIGTYASGLRSHCEALERHIACSAERSMEAGLAVLDEVGTASYEELGKTLPRAMDLLVGPSSYTLFTLQDGRLTATSELSRMMPDASCVTRFQHLPDELAVEISRNRRVVSIRNCDDLPVLGGVGLIAAPIISAQGERLIGVLLVQTMDAARIGAGAERCIGHLARKLSHPLGRQRVVVSFQRDRHSPRTTTTVDEALSLEQGRMASVIAQEARKSGPD